jgi:hypothetical protein
MAKGDADAIGRDSEFELSSSAKVSVAIQGVERILKISGPSLHARLALSNSEAARIGELLSRPMNLKNKKTGEQVVFFPRKTAKAEA